MGCVFWGLDSLAILPGYTLDNYLLSRFDLKFCEPDICLNNPKFKLQPNKIQRFRAVLSVLFNLRQKQVQNIPGNAGIFYRTDQAGFRRQDKKCAGDCSQLKQTGFRRGGAHHFQAG